MSRSLHLGRLVPNSHLARTARWKNRRRRLAQLRKQTPNRDRTLREPGITQRSRGQALDRALDRQFPLLGQCGLSSRTCSLVCKHKRFRAARTDGGRECVVLSSWSCDLLEARHEPV